MSPAENLDRRPVVAFITLGCKANQYDTAALMALVPADKYLVLEGGDSEPPIADIYVINTCAVTGKSAYQCRQMVRRAKHWNPNAQVVVTGCLARTEPDSLLAAGADLVASPFERDRVVHFFQGRIARPGNFFYHPEGGRQMRGRAVVKVQDGCNFRCAYCTVPLARGPSRSLPVPAVLEQLEALAAQGFNEAVLTGIHLGLYGADLGTSLVRLLETLAAAPHLPQRLRLSSLDPQDLTPELIEIMAASDRLCPHLHLPLQSGDADVLREMRRPYTPEEFAAQVENAAARLPTAAIGIDLIAGFPGETDAAHGNTIKLVRRLPLAYFHVFPFSRRPGTPAAERKDQVPAEVVKARARELREAGAEKKRDFLAKQLGRTLSVLAESWSQGLISGTSDNYARVKFEGPRELLDSIVEVRADQVSGQYLSGKIS